MNDALSERELNGEGALGVRQAVIDARDAGTLVELPSTREAFIRYLKLGASQQADIEGEGGLDISPKYVLKMHKIANSKSCPLSNRQIVY